MVWVSLFFSLQYKSCLFANIMRKYTWSFKTSIYKGCYSCSHIKVHETDKNQKSKKWKAYMRHMWSIYDSRRQHSLRKRPLINGDFKYYSIKRIIYFLPEIMEHYRFDSHHRHIVCFCFILRALVRDIGRKLGS